jgi:transposase-like protein
MGKRGPKSNFDPSIDLCTIALYAEKGATDTKIARALGISYKQFKVWKQKYPEIGATMKAPKEMIDNNVVSTLYKRAMGYSYQERTIETILDKDGKPTGEKKMKVVEKEVPPGESSLQFWTRNRRPDEWRDTRHIDIENDDDIWDRMDKELAKAKRNDPKRKRKTKKAEKANDCNS